LLEVWRIWMELKVLHRHGWTVSQLARELGISRTTVCNELASETPRRYRERAKPRSCADPRPPTGPAGGHVVVRGMAPALTTRRGRKSDDTT
jgi:hypothetical protein